jgi:hypothetical protein
MPTPKEKAYSWFVMSLNELAGYCDAVAKKREKFNASTMDDLRNEVTETGIELAKYAGSPDTISSIESIIKLSKTKMFLTVIKDINAYLNEIDPDFAESKSKPLLISRYFAVCA